MDFTQSPEFQSIFGTIFKDATAPSFYVDQDVTAEIHINVIVTGKLVSMPTKLNQFCVVNGFINKSGVSTKDTHILVPLNLLKAKKC